MELNGFRVSILGSQEETSDGYVTMQHNQQYSIQLFNHHKGNGCAKPCDAEVYVDEKYCGTFRVSHGQYVVIEHPIHDKGRFTAYRPDTWEGSVSGVDRMGSERGLIKVVFKPGSKKAVMPVVNCTVYNSCGGLNGYYNTTSCSSEPVMRRLSSMGTGLSGSSSQNFYNVDELNYDEAPTTIYLRLAFREPIVLNSCHPVYATNMPRPL